MIALVCLHHQDTANSSRTISLSLFEIGTSKNGVKRTSDSSTSALHSQVSTKVNTLHVFFFLVLFGHIRQLVINVCALGHAVCV